MQMWLRVRWIALAILIVTTGIGCGHTASSSASRPGHWTHTERAHAGKPVLIDYRDNFDTARIKEHPSLLTVSMHYAASDPKGGPDAAQRASLVGIERRLLQVIGSDGANILVAVIESDQQYDWYFYVTDAEAAQGFARSTLKNSGVGFAPTVVAEDDAGGAFYAKLTASDSH